MAWPIAGLRGWWQRPRAALTYLLGGVSVALATACWRHRGDDARQDAGNASASIASGATATAQPERVVLSPLIARGSQVELDESGHPAVRVAVPLGAREARPLIWVLDMAPNRMEKGCQAWQEIGRGWPFVLCASDTESGSKDGLRDVLKRLKGRFGAHLSPGPVVLVGWQHGTLAAALLREEPSFFSRVVLGEDAVAEWSSGLAHLFAERGGQKVMFACGNPSCTRLAEQKALLAARAGLEARVVQADDASATTGIVSGSALVGAIQSDWPWLVDRDPRWADLRAASSNTER